VKIVVKSLPRVIVRPDSRRSTRPEDRVLTSGWRDIAQSQEPPPHRRVAATVGPSAARCPGLVDQALLDGLGKKLGAAQLTEFGSDVHCRKPVSSLLRKLGATDRRELANLAARRKQAESEPTAAVPSPLTSFVGRTRG
jgi:hypothetical protein